MSATATNYAAHMAEQARLSVISNARAGFKLSAVAAAFFAIAFVCFAVGALTATGTVAIGLCLYVVLLCGLGAYVFAADARYYRETVREFTAKAPLC